MVNGLITTTSLINLCKALYLHRLADGSIDSVADDLVIHGMFLLDRYGKHDAALQIDGMICSYMENGRSVSCSACTTSLMLNKGDCQSTYRSALQLPEESRP